MKRIEVLILDDNFVIANKIKKRLFTADKIYKYASGIELYAHYLEVDNHNPEKAAIAVNNYIKENEIKYLLLDRGFGKIIEPRINNSEKLDSNYLYKDNNLKGYSVEHLLSALKNIKKNALSQVKGIIIYTYDDYRELNKQGDVIKDEIINELKNIIHKNVRIDVLLSYSDIYKLAGVDLYEGYAGEGIVKLGRKNGFILYGLFVGELLYHKTMQMIIVENNNLIKEKKIILFYRLLILYLVFISISVGANAISTYLFNKGGIMIGVVSILFGIIIPLIILLLKPSLLIDIEKD